MALKSAGSSPASPIIVTLHNNYVVSHINLSLKRRNKKICLKFTNRNLLLVRILYKLNVINSYVNLQNSYIAVSPTFFKNSPFFSQIKQVSSAKKSFYVSNQSLKLISKSLANSFVLVETSSGVITHVEAIKLNVGGKIVCVIS